MSRYTSLFCLFAAFILLASTVDALPMQRFDAYKSKRSVKRYVARDSDEAVSPLRRLIRSWSCKHVKTESKMAQDIKLEQTFEEAAKEIKAAVISVEPYVETIAQQESAYNDAIPANPTTGAWATASPSADSDLFVRWEKKPKRQFAVPAPGNDATTTIDINAYPTIVAIFTETLVPTIVVQSIVSGSGSAASAFATTQVQYNAAPIISNFGSAATTSIASSSASSSSASHSQSTSYTHHSHSSAKASSGSSSSPTKSAASSSEVRPSSSQTHSSSSAVKSSSKASSSKASSSKASSSKVSSKASSHSATHSSSTKHSSKTTSHKTEHSSSTTSRPIKINSQSSFFSFGESTSTSPAASSSSTSSTACKAEYCQPAYTASTSSVKVGSSSSQASSSSIKQSSSSSSSYSAQASSSAATAASVTPSFRLHDDAPEATFVPETLLNAWQDAAMAAFIHHGKVYIPKGSTVIEPSASSLFEETETPIGFSMPLSQFEAAIPTESASAYSSLYSASSMLD